MVVTRDKKKFLSTFLLLVASLNNLCADMMEKGRTKVKSIFNLYHQNSNDGAQVVDNNGREEANVVEPMIFIEHQINEDTAITGHVVFDAWTAASDTKLDNYTGASGEPIKNQARIAANLGVKREKKVEKNRWVYGANIGFSSEYDYQSINASFNVSRSFAKDNFTIGFGAQYYMDEVSLFDSISNPETAVIQDGLKRNIMAFNLTASQILTTKDIIQFDVTFAKSDGYLESTANTVLINGQRELESLPETRSRYAATTKWVHGLSKTSSMNLSYRHYRDQWDLTGNTLRLAYLFEPEEDESYVELFTRYHNQTSVEYFSKSFVNNQNHMTSDSDLEDFTSYEAGVFYEANQNDFSLFGFGLEEITWSHSVAYGTRNNGMRYGYYQTGFGFYF